MTYIVIDLNLSNDRAVKTFPLFPILFIYRNSYDVLQKAFVELMTLAHVASLLQSISTDTGFHIILKSLLFSLLLVKN